MATGNLLAEASLQTSCPYPDLLVPIAEINELSRAEY
jgi:hypothetical protein